MASAMRITKVDVWAGDLRDQPGRVDAQGQTHAGVDTGASQDAHSRVRVHHGLAGVMMARRPARRN